jgi:hypothetical protein
MKKVPFEKEYKTKEVFIYRINYKALKYTFVLCPLNHYDSLSENPCGVYTVPLEIPLHHLKNQIYITHENSEN